MVPTLAALLLRGGPEGPGRVLLDVAERPGSAGELAGRADLDRRIVEAHLATLEARALVVCRGSSYLATPAGASLAGRLEAVLATVVATAYVPQDMERSRSPPDRSGDDARRPD